MDQIQQFVQPLLTMFGVGGVSLTEMFCCNTTEQLHSFQV